MAVKSYITVPRESLDAILWKMFSESNDDTFKRKLWNIGGAIGRLGTSTVKDRSGKDIDVYRIPSTWFNWIKDQYESPI